MICNICPRGCNLSNNQIGFCKARKCTDGEIRCDNYGKITSIALDPIEKKPLYHFYPGSYILSVGSYGCNMRCPHCQNSSISMDTAESHYISPEKLLDLAVSSPDNIGAAFTYNEPLIGMEYLTDTAPLLKEAGLKTVVVTNGYACEEPLKKLLPYVDAMNIDVKGFTEEFYQKLGGSLETVKKNAELCVSFCHVEITTLIIPGENDNDWEMEELAAWLSSLSPDIPLHITRFFPRYRMTEKQPTPIDTLIRLAGIARKYVKTVHIGNV